MDASRLILSRRQALVAAGLVSFGVPAISLTAGCAASIIALDAPVAGWLASLAESVAASVIADGIEKGIPAAYHKFIRPSKIALDKQSNQTLIAPCWGQTKTPVVWLQAKSRDGNVASDSLVACTNDGKFATVPSWGWRTLAGFINHQIGGKKDDDLANAVNSIQFSVLPARHVKIQSATRIQWLTQKGNTVSLSYHHEPNDSGSVIFDPGEANGDNGVGALDPQTFSL